MLWAGARARSWCSGPSALWATWGGVTFCIRGNGSSEWLGGLFRVTPPAQGPLGPRGQRLPRLAPLTALGVCPHADCLLMLAYKDRAERAKGLRERSSLMLEDICGLEPGLPYEGLAHTLAIVCLSQAVMLGFDSREAMCAWDARIRYALGEGE